MQGPTLYACLHAYLALKFNSNKIQKFTYNT